ncbi:MAG TPA: 16S rRNA (cytosine(967)-C(5))-methyltransferase RsmB [Gemmatimonadaceae bacterium]|nr:16S rRNA (cytosine(967)-C(5))-methyltransferase RsmB [Gemmatimonadaceae bacterium]
MSVQYGGVQTAVGGVTTPRVIAAGICADLRSGEMLDSSFERRTQELEARDRRWLRELIYGMLRQRGAIDAILDERVRGGLSRVDADLVDLMRLGVYQLLHMGSVPAYAAIAQTVELAKVRHGIGASKLMNAVLRRIDRESSDLSVPLPPDPLEALAVRYSHPRWLVARWLSRWGEETTAILLMKNNAEAPMVIRPYGIVREQLEAMLEASGVDVGDAPLARDSIQIGGGIGLTDLGAFKQGLFFVQDPGSTLVTQYASIPQDAVVADLCAAPGGKALELSRTARIVLAADRSPQRLVRLLENCARLEANNVYVVAGDARLPVVWNVDAVLIDVPCTGTGTFRRHPDARWRLKVSDLSVMAALQAGILRAAAAVVKPGGLLIYSTCSLEAEENERQVEDFLARNAEFTLDPPPAGAVPPDTIDGGYLRVLPQVHGSDGAFAARLRRSH